MKPRILVLAVAVLCLLALPSVAPAENEPGGKIDASVVTVLEATGGNGAVPVMVNAPGALDQVHESDVDGLTRQRTILCISEAVANMLLHGGGQGSMTLRRLDDRLRVVVADDGPGMNFLNWMGPPTKKGQASMGYGFQIILDYLDAVGLRTGRTGTTLLLDRKTD